LWQVLSITDSKLIDGASTGPVSFVQLFEQPEAYRGELVGLDGVVHRSEWFEAPENTAKVPGYHRLIVRLKDGPSRPVFLYCLSLPADFPEGEKLHEDFEATAFFYKNWNYQANEVSYIAPVLLARDITWLPVVADPRPIPSLKVILGTTAVVGLVAALFAFYVYRRSRLMFGDPSGHGQAATESEIARLAELPAAPPISEQLRQLAEKE
jgi:hypothetical protein